MKICAESHKPTSFWIGDEPVDIATPHDFEKLVAKAFAMIEGGD